MNSTMNGFINTLLTVMAIVATSIACRKSEDASPVLTARSTTEIASSKSASATSPSAKPYTLEIKAPETAALNQTISTLIRLVPKAPYKVNMEYPIKLELSSDAKSAVTPNTIVMKSDRAEKIDASEVILRPEFTVTGSGAHTFSGTFKFSVCTEAQCEIKEQSLQWVTQVP